MRSKLPALALTLTVLLIGLGVWWYAAPLQGQAGDSPTQELTPSSPGMEEEQETRPEQAAPLAARRSADSFDLKSGEAGGVFLRVLDIETALPVEGLAFQVFSLGPRAQQLQAGTTDGDGRAALEHLPRAGIAVRTQRQPPYAESNQPFEVSLAAGGEFEMRVGKGGTLRGRVLDDEGRALGGVAIRQRSISLYDGGFGDGPLSTKPIVATTEPSGEFQIPCLLSRPRGFALVQGELRATRVDVVELQAEDPRVPGRLSEVVFQDVQAGQVVDLPQPIVLPSLQILEGIVLDKRGAAAGKLLVSGDRGGRPELRGYPPLVLPTPLEFLESSFHLQASESVSAEDGSFRLRIPFSKDVERKIDLWVITPEGVVENFYKSLESDSSGRLKRVELRLRQAPRVEVALLDAEGRPFVPKAWTKDQRAFHQRAFIGVLGELGQVEARLISDEGAVEILYTKPDRGGVLTLIPRFPLESIRTIRVHGGDFKPARAQCSAGLKPGQRYPIAVELFPRVRIDLSLGTGWSNVDPEAFRFTLGVNSSVPAEPAQSEERSEGQRRVQYGDLCGLGSSWGPERMEPDFWRGAVRQLDMPALAEGLYWVYVGGRGPSWEFPLQWLGPFAAGATRHAVRISPAGLRKRKAQEKAQVRPRSKATAKIAWALVQPVDAISGGPIESGHLRLEPVPADSGRVSALGLRPMGEGVLRAGMAWGGTYRLRLEAEGYRHVDLGQQAFVVGEKLQLGRIEMSPIESFRIRLLEAPDTPVAEGTVTAINGSRRTRVGEDGLLTVERELPAAFVIAVGDDYSTCRFVEVPQWSPESDASKIDEEVVPALREVEFLFRGLQAEREFAYLTPRVQAHLRYADAYTEPTYTVRGLEEFASSDPTVRTFRNSMGLGEYTLLVHNVLYTAPDLVFQVEAGEGLQRVEVQLELR